jgi:hypothetical protein
MSINTRHTDIAQASSTVSPERIAQRQRHIRILRAVALVARTKCGVAVAARAVGLSGRDAMQELYDLLDLKKIPRKRRWGTRLAVPHTQEPVPAYVRPRGQGEGEERSKGDQNCG